MSSNWRRIKRELVALTDEAAADSEAGRVSSHRGSEDGKSSMRSVEMATTKRSIDASGSSPPTTETPSGDAGNNSSMMDAA